MKKMMLLAVALVALIASPAAAQYGGGTLVLSESSVAPGDSVELSCSGLEPGADYSVLFDGAEVGDGTVDDSGTAAGTFTTDSATPAGTYEVEIMTDGGGCTSTLEILGEKVDAENPEVPGFVDGPTPGGTNPTQAGNGTLPRTGTSDGIRTTAMIGAGLLAAGGMITLAMRRKIAA